MNNRFSPIFIIEIIEIYKFYESLLLSMEKSERTKYYPISLKDKELHDRFVIVQKLKKFKNADQMIQYLLELEEKNQFLEKRCTQKENDFNELIDKISEKNEMIKELEGKLEYYRSRTERLELDEE